MSFHDEFNTSRLNRRIWSDSYWNSRTHGDDELEYYAPDDVTTGHGRLRLKAEKREMGGKPYTSGMVTSFGTFAQQYGWFEIRAKFPRGKGMWPAFWLLPTTKAWPPEIDILEILGHEPSKIYFSTHWRDVAGKHQFHTESYNGPDFSAGYHTIAVRWEPTQITWYVDGVAHCRSSLGIPHEPMYLLANLAVGGGWPGNPDANTPLPASMDVDYIRVYQRVHP